MNDGPMKKQACLISNPFVDGDPWANLIEAPDDPWPNLVEAPDYTKSQRYLMIDVQLLRGDPFHPAADASAAAVVAGLAAFADEFP